MKKQEIFEVIEKNLFFMKAKIFEGTRKITLHVDGKFRQKCGWYKVELMELMRKISEIDCKFLK